MTPLAHPPRHTTLTSAVLCRPVPSSELISVGESDLDLLCCGFNSHSTKMGTIVGSGWAQVGRRWVLSHDAAHMCMSGNWVRLPSVHIVEGVPRDIPYSWDPPP